VLVLGSEGSGLQQGVQAQCDLLIRISPRATRDSHLFLDSLNVNVAAGTILHQLLSPVNNAQ